MTKRNTTCAVVGASLLLSNAAIADGDIKATYEATLAFVSTTHNCIRSDYPDFIFFNCSKSDKPAGWYFTKPGSPAHPGVIERYLSNEKDGAHLITDAYSWGSDEAQPAFKAWMAGVAQSIGGPLTAK